MRELSIADFRQLTEGEKQSHINTFSLPPSKIKDFCHLPHQREAGCGGSLKPFDKLEFEIMQKENPVQCDLHRETCM